MAFAPSTKADTSRKAATSFFMGQLLLYAMMAGEILQAGLLGSLICRKRWNSSLFALCCLLTVDWAIAYVAWTRPHFFPNYPAIYWGTGMLEYLFAIPVFWDAVRDRNWRIIAGLGFYFAPTLIELANKLPAWFAFGPELGWIVAIALWFTGPSRKVLLQSADTRSGSIPNFSGIVHSA